MRHTSRDTDLVVFFQLEIVSRNPVGMVLPLEVKLPLECQLLLVDGIDAILLNVNVGVVVVLPQGGKVGVCNYLCPLPRVEVFVAVPVAHELKLLKVCKL